MRKKRKYLTGSYSSPKAGKIFYRSSYELRYYIMLDEDISVLNYIVEPFKIPYKFNKRIRNYIPDILVEFIDNAKMLVEIKPEKLVDKPKNVAKRKSAVKYCVKNKIEYKLITEIDLI